LFCEKVLVGKLDWLPAKPPYNDEEPKYDDEKHNVPQPFASMPLGHVVHSTKGA